MPSLGQLLQNEQAARVWLTDEIARQRRLFDYGRDQRRQQQAKWQRLAAERTQAIHGIMDATKGVEKDMLVLRASLRSDDALLAAMDSPFALEKYGMDLVRRVERVLESWARVEQHHREVMQRKGTSHFHTLTVADG